MRITDWLVDTMDIQSVSGVSTDGDKTYSAARTVRARIEEKHSLVVNTEGKEVKSDHWIATEEPVKYDDLLLLPSETETRRPIMVKTAAIKNGAYRYYEVFL